MEYAKSVFHLLLKISLVSLYILTFIRRYLRIKMFAFELRLHNIPRRNKTTMTAPARHSLNHSSNNRIRHVKGGYYIKYNNNNMYTIILKNVFHNCSCSLCFVPWHIHNFIILAFLGVNILEMHLISTVLMP